MQTIDAALQTAFELGTSNPERVLNYHGFLVNNSNKYLDFTSGGGTVVAEITTGTYFLGTSYAETGSLCKAIKDAIDAVDPAMQGGEVSMSNGKMYIGVFGSLPFGILWKTGTHGLDNANDNIGTLVGFDITADDTGAQDYLGDNVIDKTKYVSSWGAISRNAESVSAGNVALEVINTDQSWNGILSSPASHFGPNFQTSSVWLGYTGIGFINLFTGNLDDADFAGVDSVGLTFRDKIAEFTKKQVGSSQSPADYYSSASYTVFTSSDWSAGRNPADIIWHLLTYWGGLDSTESTANTDIDWTTFSEFKNILSSIAYTVQAKFQGQDLTTALKEICEKTNSTVFSEMDGKIYCRYWLGSDTVSIQTYTSAKWDDLPKIDIDKLAIKNRYEVYYGYTFPVSATGTATGATSTTLLLQSHTNTATAGTNATTIECTGAGWGVNAWQNYYCHISGRGSVLISSNDADTLTLSGSGITGAVSGDAFIISLVNWTANDYKSKFIHIKTGTGIGQTRMIASNDGTTLTINFAWSTNPVATDTFEILDYDKAVFSGCYTKNDTTSQTNYGIKKEIIDSNLVWFYNEVSATGYGERAIVANKDPIQRVTFSAGLGAYRQQLWDALYLTETFYSWTNQGFRVENLSFNIDAEEVEIQGRLTSLYHYLILDSIEYGALDSVNVLA